MFHRFYEALFFKPYYVQCIVIFIFTLGLSLWGYFFYIESERSEIRLQLSENNKLENQLKKEKSQHEQLLRAKALQLPQFGKYSSEFFWFHQLIELFKNKPLFFKKIEVKKGVQEDDHQNIFIHLSLTGSYWNLLEAFWKLFEKFYFVSIEDLSIQKSQNKGEGGKIDAKVVFKIYLFK